MLVYCNGDSFTAGVHLSDHVYPGFLGDFTREELTTRASEIKRFMETKAEYAEKFVIADELKNRTDRLEFFDKLGPGMNRVFGAINELEKHYSYTAELELLDSSIKTINNAVAGASMGGICQRTLLDLLELKSKNIKVDTVVIQLTSVGRYEIYDANYSYFLLDRPLGYFKSNNEHDKRISDAVTLKYSNYDLTIKFLYHLITLKEAVLSMTGKLPVLIDSMNSEHTVGLIQSSRAHIKIVNPDSLDKFDLLVEQSMINTAHHMFMFDLAKQVERPYSHDGHYSQAVHKLTAAELIKLL
jgi:hypothetical protein